ncbi:MAG: tRNA guanosine(34) transglycosylase Tgt [Planctomycetota bacterium]|jgi:queuine tRNA-ribosyltransferase
MKFVVQNTDRESAARKGLLEIRGHRFSTPAFMPVGTAATVKGALPRDLMEAGVEVLLCNTYHLHLRPGEEVVARSGGLHRFMDWDGAILTDSGGYQVFSLADLVQVDEDGVTFRSHVDGEKIRLEPETVVIIQARLDSDIFMPLDECVEYPAPREAAAAAVERTALWAERASKAHRTLDTDTALFGIVQGGAYRDLRERSAGQITGMDFDGFAVGGLSVGEGKEIMREVLEYTAPLLPAKRPRYLMGVGTPDDILDAVAMGVDLFDCVLPTRNARNATLFTSRGQMKLRGAALRDDPDPPDPDCDCPLCRRYSRAYIRHLFNTHEMLGPMLATLHNVHFYQKLMREIRIAIEAGYFTAFRTTFLDKYLKSPQENIDP